MLKSIGAVVQDLAASLEQAPSAFVQAVIRDEVDPDDTTLSYLSEGHRRTLGSLRILRAMARVTEASRVLAPLFASALVPHDDGQARVSVAHDDLDRLAEVIQRNTWSATKTQLTARMSEIMHRPRSRRDPAFDTEINGIVTAISVIDMMMLDQAQRPRTEALLAALERGDDD